MAEAWGSEVVSADSQLVYSNLCIGVARPTDAEMRGITHHMIGVVSPTERYSAGQYADQARPILERLQAEGRVPVVVGGTGFYIRTLLQPGHVPSVPPDLVFRARLQAQIQEEQTGGVQALHADLQQLDPRRAAAISPTDTPRIIRALELIHQTGTTVPPTPKTSAYPVQAIGLMYANRTRHREVIRTRLDAMLSAGFLDEVERVYTQYGDCPALQHAHGYPELLDVLLGRRVLEDALEQIALNIYRYSKRQMTWFRSMPDTEWHAVDEQTPEEMMCQVLASTRDRSS
jgi:tRNA dimethylallyltransferase